jgi:hypothetical protein
VLISGPAVFPIEFKCGESHHRLADYNQAWDYASDLKNFHAGSHEAPIFPILVATQAQAADDAWQPAYADGVRPPYRCNARYLRRALLEGVAQSSGREIDANAWGSSSYQPTPTIIEAARALYARHSVEAISRHDAGARNLRLTSVAVEEIIERVRGNSEKAIVFVTGVPGAGKTLVGLNVATRRRTFGEARAVYLSGNGPLVAVLQEALTRDELARVGNTERKGAVRQRVKPFIQNVHHFRDEGVRMTNAPYDHVVIFDEAQLAWTQAKTSDFMRRRKKLANFDRSEPEFLISYLDRHETWTVVCAWSVAARRFIPVRPASGNGLTPFTCGSGTGAFMYRRTSRIRSTLRNRHSSVSGRWHRSRGTNASTSPPPCARSDRRRSPPS